MDRLLSAPAPAPTTLRHAAPVYTLQRTVGVVQQPLPAPWGLKLLAAAVGPAVRVCERQWTEDVSAAPATAKRGVADLCGRSRSLREPCEKSSARTHGRRFSKRTKTILLPP